MAAAFTQRVPVVLHQMIDLLAMLINYPPYVVRFAINLNEDFVQMSFVARPRAAPPQLISIRLPKLLAPLAYLFSCLWVLARVVKLVIWCYNHRQLWKQRYPNYQQYPIDFLSPKV